MIVSLGHPIPVTIKLMTEPLKRIFSWRLKLILTCGGILGLALGIFSFHVARMDDSPNGTTPISWTFKAKSHSILKYFRVEDRAATDPKVKLPPPAIDRLIPEKTEFALFALG